MPTTKKTKKSISAKKLCRKVIKHPGINQKTGQLNKGWKWPKGGGAPVKVTASKTTKTKKLTGLRAIVSSTAIKKPMCARRNADGSTTLYTPHSDDAATACPLGGRLQQVTLQPMAMGQAALNGARRIPARQKKAPAKRKAASKKK